MSVHIQKQEEPETCDGRSVAAAERTYLGESRSSENGNEDGGAHCD